MNPDLMYFGFGVLFVLAIFFLASVCVVAWRTEVEVCPQCKRGVVDPDDVRCPYCAFRLE